MAHQQLHARISASLYEELKSIASKQQISINKMIEVILQKFIEDNRRRRLSDDFNKYINETAEHSSEFTEEFDPIVTRKLLEDTEW